MSRNKENVKVKKKLIETYGEQCMFQSAQVAERLEKKRPTIQSYKRFTEKKILKGTPISEQLSVHHLKHRSEGRK